MSTRSAKRWLGVAVVWLIITGSLAVLARHWDFGQTFLSKPNDISRHDPPPPPPTVTTKTIRFMSGTDKIMSYSQVDLDELAKELANNKSWTMVIVGHISPGTFPDEEKKLAENQIDKLKSFFCVDRNIDERRITFDISDLPNEDGAYGVATCKVYK